MPFPITPDPRLKELETDFMIQDPFGLRRAVTPVFAFDTQEAMLTDLRTGTSTGLAWISTERESADIDPAIGFI